MVHAKGISSANSYPLLWLVNVHKGYEDFLMSIGSLISGAFSGLIAAGITNGLDGARGLRAW
jgi:hypothetical protein